MSRSLLSPKSYRSCGHRTDHVEGVSTTMRLEALLNQNGYGFFGGAHKLAMNLPAFSVTRDPDRGKRVERSESGPLHRSRLIQILKGVHSQAVWGNALPAPAPLPSDSNESMWYRSAQQSAERPLNRPEREIHVCEFRGREVARGQTKGPNVAKVCRTLGGDPSST
jgi:hypothetical protein